MSRAILNSSTHYEVAQKDRYDIHSLPIKILQIGEGNFLRGFFDWMLHETIQQNKYAGSIAVVQPRPTGKAKIEAIAAQDGYYTLVTRGLEKGKVIERKDVISVFSKVFDPYEQWDEYIALASLPDLKVVVSNTTEAGLVYRPEALVQGQPIQSYPGKLTMLLYWRYNAYEGDPTKGLICLPCELLERNGDTLRDCVLQYCEDWKLPEAFKRWVMEHNYFLNSLVDRIVTGYPKAEIADAWFDQWGYEDPLLTTAEPYHLWAIEADDKLAEHLPLAEAGLNVLWVNDLKPYQQRKVKILNGSHTFMALLGILQGVEEVKLAMEHEYIGELIRNTVENEVIPTLPYDQAALIDYANEVYDRFLNPFISHRLADIAMNSLSKFKTRILPSIQFYLDKDELPEGLTAAITAFLRYFKITKMDQAFYGYNFAGEAYVVRDDLATLEEIAQIWQSYDHEQILLDEALAKLLSLSSIWGHSLHERYPTLVSTIIAQWKRWEA